ncbi:MAG: hypothetical protein IPM16_01245 [Chloroflexi bacterium]|nr:hypothetical protein [Chloroflexota bacterium]
MTNPVQTLARPLAARVANLPAPDDTVVRADVPERVAKAAVQAMADGHTHYTDRPGILPLREYAVRFLKERFEVEYGAGDVTITCGATEARFVALKLLVKPGTTIICPDGLPEVHAAGVLLGALVVSGEAGVSGDAVVVLSAASDLSTIARLTQVADSNGWWVVFDTSGAASMHPAQREALAPRVVSIGSLSSALPGWRVGWMAGSSMAGKLRAYKQSMTICTTSVSQWAALGITEGEG